MLDKETAGNGEQLVGSSEIIGRNSGKTALEVSVLRYFPAIERQEKRQGLMNAGLPLWRLGFRRISQNPSHEDCFNYPRCRA